MKVFFRTELFFWDSGTYTQATPDLVTHERFQIIHIFLRFSKIVETYFSLAALLAPHY